VIFVVVIEENFILFGFRMLGSGRPFVVEFINPRRHTFTSEQYKEMQQQINAISKFVAVTDLQPVSKYITQKHKQTNKHK
jgi:tRNA U54 and U55 pseudouridine synthase Pus10